MGFMRTLIQHSPSYSLIYRMLCVLVFLTAQGVCISLECVRLRRRLCSFSPHPRGTWLAGWRSSFYLFQPIFHIWCLRSSSVSVSLQFPTGEISLSALLSWGLWSRMNLSLLDYSLCTPNMRCRTEAGVWYVVSCSCFYSSLFVFRLFARFHLFSIWRVISHVESASVLGAYPTLCRTAVDTFTLRPVPSGAIILFSFSRKREQANSSYSASEPRYTQPDHPGDTFTRFLWSFSSWFQFSCFIILPPRVCRLHR